MLDAAGDSGRVAAAAVVGAGRGGVSRQEVRHGAEHQDGAHEADARAPAAADGLAAHAGAAAAGARAHVQVRHTSTPFKAEHQDCAHEATLVMSHQQSKHTHTI